MLFDGEVESVTSYNEEGRFDILAQHANFISLIQKKLIIKDFQGVKEIDVSNALLRMRENKVEVYLGIQDLGHLKF